MEVEVPELWPVVKRIPADDRKIGIYPASTAGSVPGRLSAVSEAPRSEDLSFRCAVKGRFRYSDLKEAAPGDYGICIRMSRS